MPSPVPLVTALRSLVGTAWPEVKPNGILRGREFVTIPWPQRAEAGQVPAAVIDIDPQPDRGRFGITNRTDLVAVRIYRVVGDSEDADELLDKLQVLRLTLYPNDESNALGMAGQVLGYPLVSDSMELPPNRYFLATQQPFYAGMVACEVIRGDTG